ncbi:MAG: cysteine desulfurase family protein [Cyanobium sp.]
MAERPQQLEGYFDACATTPPSAAALEAMAQAQQHAWANPSSLHPAGLAAAESLERSRQTLAALLGSSAADLIFCSGASEAIHLALLGSAAALPAGRLVISAVEHPATIAAAAQLQRRGWEVAVAPVDRHGLLLLDVLADLLVPPTRLVSLIWGQSEVGAVQDLAAIGALCRAAAVPLHVDAVQVVGHQPVDFAALPAQLLTCTAHKLQGPRGIALLLRKRGHALLPLIGGSQEAGLRGGTEAVVLAAGYAAAMLAACERLQANQGRDPSEPLRNQLLSELLASEGMALTGPPPGPQRLPHHLSLLLHDRRGEPLPGRRLVRWLAGKGIAASSGSACSSSSSAGAASPVLLAMGYPPGEAAAGLRLSLGPWHQPADLAAAVSALVQARQELVAH